MKYIYIVVIQPEYAMPTISSAAYNSLEKAQWYVEHRSDMPERVDDFRYKGRGCTYIIRQMALC